MKKPTWFCDETETENNKEKLKSYILSEFQKEDYLTQTNFPWQHMSQSIEEKYGIVLSNLCLRDTFIFLDFNDDERKSLSLDSQSRKDIERKSCSRLWLDWAIISFLGGNVMDECDIDIVTHILIDLQDQSRVQKYYDMFEGYVFSSILNMHISLFLSIQFRRTQRPFILCDDWVRQCRHDLKMVDEKTYIV